MEASERLLLTQEASRLGISLSDAEQGRLGRYVDLVRMWGERIRLIGDRDRRVLLTKHLPDSLMLSGSVPVTGKLVDIGSGAGLPGLIVACVRPELDVWLIEARRRRASFLLEAATALGLPRVRVVEDRAEEAARSPELRGRTDVVTARAVALDLILGLSGVMLAPEGRVLLMQAGAFTDEKARSLAGRYSLGLERIVDYRLAGGEARRIAVLKRAGGVSRET